MKVKCDHRSKFSNLSNWKEEAWKKKKKNQGFNGIRTRDLRDTGAMLYQLSYEATHWERGLLSNCLNWKIYCDDHSSLWSTTTAVQIYELFHIYFTSWKHKYLKNEKRYSKKENAILLDFEKPFQLISDYFLVHRHFKGLKAKGEKRRYFLN